jgi:gas vesicle protein
MKASSLNEIKKELGTLPDNTLLALCIRLAKYKKDNKELLSYLLFEAHNEQEYVSDIKKEMLGQFLEINKSTLYFAKKSLRKILRTINKFIKYSGSKQTELEIRVYYCQLLKASGISFQKSTVLTNLYDNQIKKIKAAYASFHEDLQYDFKEDVEKVSSY